MIECYLELEKFLISQNCPLQNIQLARRRIYLLAGEKKWIGEFIKEFENE